MPLRAPPCAASPVLTDPLQEVYETAIDLHLSTADRHAVGIHPRVNIESAGWVNIGSAPTDLVATGTPGGRAIRAPSREIQKLLWSLPDGFKYRSTCGRRSVAVAICGLVTG